MAPLVPIAVVHAFGFALVYRAIDIQVFAMTATYINGVEGFGTDRIAKTRVQ